MKRAAGLVAVIAKAPRPGACKTRLCPPLAPPQASDLARAFLLDTLAAVDEAGLDAHVLCRDSAEQASLEHLVRATDAGVVVQDGSGLGDALSSAFDDGLGRGYPAVGVLASDSPTLPPRVLASAFHHLTRGADVSLGPCDDGGYYLLAARANHRLLWRDMPWGTNAVAAETLRRCEALGLRVKLLPTWYDVDDAPSLARLRDELSARPPGIAPNSRAMLEQLGFLGARADSHRLGRVA